MSGAAVEVGSGERGFFQFKFYIRVEFILQAMHPLSIRVSFLSLLLALTLRLLGQTPYNPDADSNNHIGVSDLAIFLTHYGLDWNPDSLVIYYVSELATPAYCLTGYCGSPLPVEIPQDADVIINDIDDSSYTYGWLPENPKHILFLGIATSVHVTIRTHAPSGRQYVDYLRSTPSSALVFGFNGEWWIL